MMYTCIMPLAFIGLTLLHTGSEVVAVPSTQLHAQQTAGYTPSVQAPVYPNSEGEYGLLSPCIFSLSIKGRMQYSERFTTQGLLNNLHHMHSLIIQACHSVLHQLHPIVKTHVMSVSVMCCHGMCHDQGFEAEEAKLSLRRLTCI